MYVSRDLKEALGNILLNAHAGPGPSPRSDYAGCSSVDVTNSPSTGINRSTADAN